MLALFRILAQQSLREDSGSKEEQIFFLALCHNFTKPIKSVVSPPSSYTLCTFKRFCVFQRTCGNNFAIVFRWFLPLMVFTASGVHLRQDLWNWEFPGSAVQGPARDRAHFKYFIVAEIPLIISRVFLSVLSDWNSKWLTTCLLVLDS